MTEVHSVVIPELSGDVPRRLYVYLPTAAETEPDRRFPVLYMFDGHNVFFDDHATYGKSWGLGEYLDWTDTPLMVVAAECSHVPANSRLSEYSPFDFSARWAGGTVHGRGRQTMDWFVKTLKPWVDEHYPTQPDREHTMIAGSSMGGLMSLYALLEYNDVFSRAAALSPALEVAWQRMRELIRTAELQPGSVLYMDYGSDERGWMRHTAARFGSCAAALMKRGVHVTARVVPDGDHSEASWERQTPFFLSTILYGLEA